MDRGILFLRGIVYVDYLLSNTLFIFFMFMEFPYFCGVEKRRNGVKLAISSFRGVYLFRLSYYSGLKIFL